MPLPLYFRHGNAGLPNRGKSGAKCPRGRRKRNVMRAFLKVTKVGTIMRGGWGVSRSCLRRAIRSASGNCNRPARGTLVASRRGVSDWQPVSPKKAPVRAS